MPRARTLLVSLLLLLFVGFSFNAYACLWPVSGATAPVMGNGCSTPDEQPAYQFCDAFKTLSVQSPDTLRLNSDCQVICSEDTASVGLLIIRPSISRRLADRPRSSPPRDLLLKISVLRI